MPNNVGVFPELFSKMQFDLGLLDREPRPMELIDGHLIPRATTTIIATNPGSGKSTSTIRSCASASATGLWTMFGTRQHDRPLRCAVVLGEDNARTFEGVLASLPADTRHHLRVGVEQQRLMISPFRTFTKTQAQSDLLGANGKLTELGDTLFRAMRQFRPDVMVFDTISSLSECSYLARTEAYATMNALNDIAEDCDSALLLMMHLTKTGSEKLDEKSTAEDLTREISGSAGLVGAARHAIAMARAPRGKFENVELHHEKDELWMCGVKTNVVPGAANKLFPVIRDYEQRVLRTTSMEGTPLVDYDTTIEASVMADLKAELPLFIMAAAELRSPFPQSQKNKFSLELQVTGSLSGVLPKATAGQISRALADLERDQKVVACKSARANGAVVWDVPGGAFARESDYETFTKGKLSFCKGAPDAIRLAERVEEIRRMNPLPEVERIWMSIAEGLQVDQSGNIIDIAERRAGAAE
ncbi:AAA family ATPase [Cereibacter johrii]|uniref:AAA family ATPase n=1 Tax=Cereibacter johrii TaxID=445629 RepID=UPI002B25A3E5|nr:AAA family ATPase [Cereibacter johrii]MEA5159961.1 AAA family ATPase [Cereibacter johrii]